MQNSTELLELHESIEKSAFKKTLYSRWFTLLFILILFMFNLTIAHFFPPEWFQRMGALNVGFGVLLLALPPENWIA
jgi:hypothetical protein